MFYLQTQTSENGIPLKKHTSFLGKFKLQQTNKKDGFLFLPFDLSKNFPLINFTIIFA